MLPIRQSILIDTSPDLREGMDSHSCFMREPCRVPGRAAGGLPTGLRHRCRSDGIGIARRLTPNFGFVPVDADGGFFATFP